MEDPAMLLHAIINGLKPSIKLHVMQSSQKTIEHAIQMAKLAEAVQSAVPDTWDELSRTIAAYLADKSPALKFIASVAQYSWHSVAH